MTTTQAVAPPEPELPKHPTLAAALAAFQEELPEIKKGNTAEVPGKDGKRGYTYDYADLSDISPVVLRRLGAHGLSWTTSPTIIPDMGFVLTYELLHESGETREGIYPLPASNTPAQQLGSAITYARRYCLCAVTGVAPGGDDDDAQSVPDQPPAQRAQAKARQKPIAPKAPTRDWVAEANEITSLERLTALAEEADAAGELGLKSGEGRVIDGLKARRDQLEREAAPGNPDDGPMALAGDAAPAGRQWVEEARGMTTWPEVKALAVEAKAAGVTEEVLAAILEHGDKLPDPSKSGPIPFPEPTVDWKPPTGGDAA